MTQEKKRLRVGVLFGGRSGEHEVSLASAASVLRGLDPDKYEAVPIGITKEGHWLVGAGAQKMLPEVLRGGKRVMMTADPTDAALVPLDPAERGGGQRLDVVFPVMHGTYGEDGTIQGLLELAACRLSAQASSGPPSPWIRTSPDGSCKWQRYPSCLGLRCSAPIGRKTLWLFSARLKRNSVIPCS